jgi:comEA protein
MIMKRKIFFILEKLQITRSERIAMSLLMITLVIFSTMALITEPKANYDPIYYEEIERIFYERSAQIETEREEILSRYEPQRVSDQRSIDEDKQTPAITEVSKEEPKPVNINTAGSEELQELPGIGPAYAERIIEWREENGEFTSIDQLLEIRGIGERRMEQLRPYVVLNDIEEESE